MDRRAELAVCIVAAWACGVLMTAVNETKLLLMPGGFSVNFNVIQCFFVGVLCVVTWMWMYDSSKLCDRDYVPRLVIASVLLSCAVDSLLSDLRRLVASAVTPTVIIILWLVAAFLIFLTLCLVLFGENGNSSGKVSQQTKNTTQVLGTEACYACGRPFDC
jgi:hypothetical protein